MNYIIIATIVLLITLLGVYLVIENNRKKAKNAEKQVFNQRHNEVTLHFKTKTSEFVAAGAIASKYSGTINTIVNNFFVVQAHTEDNLNQLERIVELFILTVGEEVHKHREHDTMDTLKDTMTAFAKELPTNGVAYNKDFYYESLPAMITLLKTADIADVESQDKDETDKDSDSDQNNQTEVNKLATAQI
ncbi:hypothetical protein [Pseudoalteromonas sp. MTN2-4]|uniref:hypothetical protein n=1 Tax=Pseudoalteromonas sp. MTN2-4 TaxID=3056555 RepID=UPI0036F42271